MGKEMADRVALVTGGTGHLGRHVVRRFLALGPEIHVPVYAPEEEAELREFLGDAAEAIHFHSDGDLTDPEGVDAVFAEIGDATGSGPDIVVNLAGGFAMASVEETKPETWRHMWAMNATTAFLTSRAAFPSMKVREWGRIVNVSAHPAIDRGQKLLSAYGAAKAAVLNLTQTLAREGVEHGITVNALIPSIIDTAPNREAMPDADRSTWLSPAEIAGVVAFLVSDEAQIVNGSGLTLTLG